jgi:hypothetical protein
MPSSLISSGSKKKDPRCVYLSEAKAANLHKMWADISSSVPHFLQMGLSPNPITYRCLLRVLCPMSRPIKTLDWVLLKDNRRALLARSGPEINSQTCLWVLQRPCHNARCCNRYRVWSPSYGCDLTSEMWAIWCQRDSWNIWKLNAQQKRSKIKLFGLCYTSFIDFARKIRGQ